MTDQVQDGQLWEYTDRRTGWKYVILITGPHPGPSDCPDPWWMAQVLYWDEDYEFSARSMTLTEYELKHEYKRLV